MVGCKVHVKKKKNLDWLSKFLQSDFFGSCDQHQDLRKNEKNVFCIDCRINLCRHCSKSHRLHQRLQICKYVYQDVVRLQDLQNYIDCSRIQTYKINGEKAVHLNPRPQLKDAKPSTKAKFGAACEACHRYLQDQPNRFCSIACKLSIVSAKPRFQSHEMITFPIEGFPDLPLQERHSAENDWPSTLTDTSEETQERKPTTQRLRKRKRVPTRSPLF